MKVIPRMPHVSVSPQARRWLRRSTILVGGIAAVSGLMYVLLWLLLNDQRYALRGAGVTFCVLLALAITVLTLEAASR